VGGVSAFVRCVFVSDSIVDRVCAYVCAVPREPSCPSFSDTAHTGGTIWVRLVLCKPSLVAHPG